MNIKLTTFSLIVAATCGLAFNTAAQAGEDEEQRMKPGGMRFDFGSNTYALDHVQSRHHGVKIIQPSSVTNGAAPKNLLGLDPGFLAKPAPLPVAPAPVAQPQVSAKLASNNPFASVFHNPQPNPMMAAPAQGMNFGKPNTPAAPQVAQALPQPQHHVTTNGYPKLLRAAHPRPQVATAAPAIATYGNKAAFDTGSKLPGYSNNSGSGASTNLVGTVLRHK